MMEAKTVLANFVLIFPQLEKGSSARAGICVLHTSSYLNTSHLMRKYKSSFTQKNSGLRVQAVSQGHTVTEEAEFPRQDPQAPAPVLFVSSDLNILCICEIQNMKLSAGRSTWRRNTVATKAT